MYSQAIALLCLLLLFVVWWWQRLARMRFLTDIRSMDEKGRSEIDGLTAQHWLDILNQDAAHTLVAVDTMVMIFKGREWFFVDGTVGFPRPGATRPHWGTMEGYFLIAIGKSAVQLLAEHESVFRLVAGSAELAAFSIFQWSEFVEMLIMERRR